MSGRLPRLTAREMIAALEHAGFDFVRQRGSHRIYRNREGKRVTVPYHAARVLHPKLLQAILRDSGLTTEELKEDR